MTLQGILFDKDGTLFDFRATWDQWAADLIAELSGGDPAVGHRIATEIKFDMVARRFRPDSLVIAGTGREAAECVGRALPDRDVDDLDQKLQDSAAKAPLAPAVPLAPFLAELTRRGLALGVMTNDSYLGAEAHLSSAGVFKNFDFIAGFDSGFGAKPDPDPLLAFCDHVKLAPATVAMVGDSTHDLVAGKAAGMVTIGVLTGPASAEDLTPFADVVLKDIGEIPAWLDQQTAA